jgi:hypothetical protein
MTYVRVTQKGTGYKGSVLAEQYEATPDGFDLLDDEPATDPGGVPLPWDYGRAAKPKTSVAEAAAKKKPPTGHTAASEKEKD